MVGWNPGFKSEPKLGRKTNAMFAVMPLAKIRDAISRKCEEAGIKVILTEESYTSKASFLDRDLMPVYGEETGVSFSGKRTKRGVYVSNNGTEIHADVNGAANIIRKVFPELDFQVQLIPSGMKLPSESFPQKRKPSYWRSREGISSSLERAA